MTTGFRLEDVTLVAGHHNDIRETGQGCVGDLISMMMGDAEITDTPTCVCPSLPRFYTTLNDASWSSREARTDALRGIMPLLAETRDGREIERGEYLALMARRVFAPMALRASGEVALARDLRAGRVACSYANANANANAIYAATAAYYANYANAAADAADAAALAANAAHDAAAVSARDKDRVLRVATCVLKRAALIGMDPVEIGEAERRADERVAAHDAQVASC